MVVVLVGMSSNFWRHEEVSWWFENWVLGWVGVGGSRVVDVGGTYSFICLTP